MTKISIRQIMKESWAIFKQNWLVMAAITLVSAIPSMISTRWGLQETFPGSGEMTGSWEVSVVMALVSSCHG